MADKLSSGLGWCCRVIQIYIQIWEIRCCYQGSVAIGVRYVPVRTLHRSPVHPIEVCQTLAAELQTHTFTNDICNWVLLSGLGPPAIGTTHAAARHVLYGFTGYLFMLLRRKAVIPMVCDGVDRWTAHYIALRHSPGCMPGLGWVGAKLLPARKPHRSPARPTNFRRAWIGVVRSYRITNELGN